MPVWLRASSRPYRRAGRTQVLLDPYHRPISGIDHLKARNAAVCLERALVKLRFVVTCIVEPICQGAVLLFRSLFSVCVITSLINLIAIGVVPSAEPANTTINKTTLTIVDPAQFYRTDITFSGLEKLEDQLVENIEHMLDQIHSQNPSQTLRPPVIITSFSDSAFGESQSRSLESALWRRDIDRLKIIMRKYLIAPVYEQLDNGALVFDSKLDESISTRLRNAIENSDYPQLDKILQNDQLDLERYLQGDKLSRPLVLAINVENVKAVKRLLAAGANPDKSDDYRDVSPLFVALQNGNKDVIRMLAEAGADLDELIGSEKSPIMIDVTSTKFAGLGSQIATGTTDTYLDKLNIPGLRMSPVAWALSKGKIYHATLLIELGADPNVTDYAGWTALMDALYREQFDAVEALLPVSDPRIISQDDITGRHKHKNTGLRFLPSGNALFLALRMRSDRAPEIAKALRNRATELDADAGLQLLELSAQRSASRLAWFEGRQQASIDAHRAALKVANVPSFTAQTNGVVITQAMEMLTELHEMLVITGKTLTDEEYIHVAHITEIGGWHTPLHEMLDIVSAGQQVYPVKQLDTWLQANGTPSHEDWNFDRLNTWVESITDTQQRDRLFDVLDFFELKGWRR